MKLTFVFAALALSSAAAFAQTVLDSPFQIRYASNLNVADAYVNISNSGAASNGTALSAGGNLCVNVYAFEADEQLISCCTCTVTPNGLASISVRDSLISNTLTARRPNEVVIKLLATTGGACNAGTPGTPTSGLLAWGTTVHPFPAAGAAATRYDMTETPFTPATLSATEQTRLGQLCAFTQVLGSGAGICRSCLAVGLGASSAQ